MRYRGVTRWIAGLLTAAMVLTGSPVSPAQITQAKTKTEQLSYKGYTKVWEDNFDGDSLNMKDWNVETHEPGWVNAELQEYTLSGNYTVKDGKLTITPKKTKNADGTYSYSSARVNTQNKHDFKYGIMEAKMKFPKGQGYLPAFWMMPTNENLYGQWPKCGEIDIAEVMGQDTKKLYGTLHYGEPHAQSQGTTVLQQGDFSDEWHDCAVEWEPGSIKWYVDGVLYHEEHSWYSKTAGQGEVTYPAPFDQNFYLILNLAVGGSWVGYPDETTSFDTDLQVDYVRVYQKKNYNENVKKPVRKVVLKKADKNGNFVSNASFAKKEKLDGSANWQFLTAQSGEGSAAIKNKSIVISTKDAGKEDYSIQLVQPGLPMEKGATYEVSFDAYADQARTMKVDVSGPDMNYMRYFQDTTVDLKTKKKHYKYTFKMNEDTDANSRLEFNMGAQGSAADVHITNVAVRKIKAASTKENTKKTILADGNLVYNGKFQEGDNRLGFWKIAKKHATVSVTNKDYNKRQLAVKIKKAIKSSDVRVYQKGLAFEKNKEYSVSFDAAATTTRTIKVKVAGRTLRVRLNPATKHYESIIKTGNKLQNKNVVFYLGGKKGTVTLDNVVVTENSLIKNGSFNAGTTGWSEWHESAEADVSYVIDSLSEDNAADFTIKKTGSEDWKIQLKQKNVPLEQNKYYKLTFRAKSSKNRQIRAIMQGLEDKNWEVYSGENIVDLTGKYKTYTKVFKMTAASDSKAQLSICLGAVGGKAINEQHRVCIDDVTLDVISEKEAQKYLEKGPKTQDTMIKDGTFVKGMEMWSEWHDANEADAQYEVADNEIHFTVNKTGSEDWKIQLKQDNIKLEKDHYYKLVFSGKSDLERKVRATVQGGESRGYTHYTGEYFVTLGKDYQTYEHVFKMNEATDDKTSFQICMGAVGSAINQTHNMYFKDFSLTEISEEEGRKLAKNENQTAGGGGGGSYGGGNSGQQISAPRGNKTLVTAENANQASSWNLGIPGATVTAGTGSEAGKVVATLSGTSGNIACNQAFSATGLKKVNASIKLQSDSNMTVKVGLKPKTVLHSMQRSKNAQLMRLSSLRLMENGNVSEQDTGFVGTTKEVVLHAGDTQDVQLKVDLSGTTGDLVFAMEITRASDGVKLLLSDLSIKDANMIAAADQMNNTGAWELVQTEGGSASLTSNTKGDTYEVDIKSVGTAQDYSVCVKQNNLNIKKDTAYKVTFQAKSSVARHFETNIMDPNNGYAWFGGATDKELTTEFKTFSVDIPAKRDSNYDCTTAMLQFSLGYFKDFADASVPSVVTIKDLYMEEVEAAEMPSQKPEEPDENGVLTKPIASDWSTWTGYATSPASADITISDASATYDITNVGQNDYDIALEYINKLRLEKGATYRLTAKVTSSVDRTAKVSLMNAAYKWYGGEDMKLTAETEYALNQQFTVSENTADDITLKFSLGKIDNADTPCGTITIADVSLVKVADASSETPEEPAGDVAITNPIKADWSTWTGYAIEPAQLASSVNMTDGSAAFHISNVGTADHMVALEYKDKLTLEKGAAYKIVAKVTSSVERTVKVSLMNSVYEWYGGADMELKAGTEYTLNQEFTVDRETANDITFKFSLGKIGEKDTPCGTIAISDVVLYKVNK